MALRNIDNITTMFILKAFLSFEVRGFLICRPSVSSDTGGWQIKIQGSQMTTANDISALRCSIIARKKGLQCVENSSNISNN